MQGVRASDNAISLQVHQVNGVTTRARARALTKAPTKATTNWSRPSKFQRTAFDTSPRRIIDFLKSPDVQPLLQIPEARDAFALEISTLMPLVEATKLVVDCIDLEGDFDSVTSVMNAIINRVS